MDPEGADVRAPAESSQKHSIEWVLNPRLCKLQRAYPLVGPPEMQIISEVYHSLLA